MPFSVVFLGPSLEQTEARTIFDTTYLPPIKRGDIKRVLEEGIPRSIGIIDGQFFQQFSISPKEILLAIEAEVYVYGSSSMGALRAVELSPYGMKGIGEIFDLFASGQLDADDEVAMVYDSESLRPLSVPLVNMRLALQKAKEKRLISSESEAYIIDEAKKLYYPDRSYRRVLSNLASKLPKDEISRLEVFLATTAPDAKRSDAIELLHLMKEQMAVVD